MIIVELYLFNKWKDPTTYAVTSATVEENIINGLGNGFTYYMDERDKEWLDKNNEEARGEGTSAGRCFWHEGFIAQFKGEGQRA